MAVFPEIVPRIDIVGIADQDIPFGSQESHIVFLPFGVDPSQTVSLRVTDFTGLVPMSLVLTPETGAPVIYDVTADMTEQNPVDMDVPVEFPINTAVRVYAWTK